MGSKKGETAMKDAINVCYIRDAEKIKEMEDNGFAYCNRDKSLLQ